MTGKSKSILGLKEGDSLISPNSYYTEKEKRQIVEEYLTSKFGVLKYYKQKAVTNFRL